MVSHGAEVHINFNSFIVGQVRNNTAFDVSQSENYVTKEEKLPLNQLCHFVCMISA